MDGWMFQVLYLTINVDCPTYVHLYLFISDWRHFQVHQDRRSFITEGRELWKNKQWCYYVWPILVLSEM